MYLQNYMEFYNIRLFFVEERQNFYETKYYCVFGSVIKMVPKVENFGFLIIFWFVRKKIFRPKFALFWKFCFWFFWKKFKTLKKKFFTKRMFRTRPRFCLLFHQNRTTRKYFLRGCTTVGGGGSVARRWCTCRCL